MTTGVYQLDGFFISKQVAVIAHVECADDCKQF